MKYLMFVLSFFLCFTACNTKAETIPTVVPEPPPSRPLPPPAPPAVSRPDFGQRVLVNQEIVNWIKQLDDSHNEADDIKKLIFYLDKEFTLEIDDLNYDPIVGIAGDGMLVISAQAPPPLIRFSSYQQGRIESFTPAINETFIIGITVDGEPVSMKFKKNARNDYFEIYAMEFPSGNYNIKSENEFPKLYIYAMIDDNIRNEYVHTGDFIAIPANPSRPPRQNTQTVPAQTVPAEIKEQEKTHNADTATANNVNSSEIKNAQNEHIAEAEKITEKTYNNENSENKASGYETNEVTAETLVVQEKKETAAVEAANNTPRQNTVTQTPPPSARNTVRSANLIAQGTLTTDVIFNYIKSKPSTAVITDSLVKELIDLYIEEARYEEINHDFALAQMLYQTAMLSNRQFVRANNFGGLSPIRGGFDGTFPNRERGVRAHIHQLRGYARGTVVRMPIVSPRWEMISNANRGNVHTFEQLYEKWSAYPRYREKIESLLRELYSFSDNSSRH
ncbi:MAG: glucosaminidase domain-containing protein [Treponema sp.]|nr:glucosaminidase domain-containing protein [Treponema sp.]